MGASGYGQGKYQRPPDTQVLAMQMKLFHFSEPTSNLYLSTSKSSSFSSSRKNWCTLSSAPSPKINKKFCTNRSNFSSRSTFWPIKESARLKLSNKGKIKLWSNRRTIRTPLKSLIRLPISELSMTIRTSLKTKCHQIKSIHKRPL